MSDNVFKVAGHPDNTIRFTPKTSIGSIRDGVALAHGNHGGWVIAYGDLLQMVKLAKQARRRTKRALDGAKAPRKSKRSTGAPRK